ncbi:MAG: hypothetical protein ACREL3_10925 [Gemmatimonadales bacterium]
MTRVSSAPLSTDSPTALLSLLSIGPRLMTLSMENAFAFMQQASDLVRPALPAAPLPSLRSILQPRGMCDIPETDCPPRCVCDIRWEATRGETLRCTIAVTNTSKVARTFQLSATPFMGADSKAAIALAPHTLQLAGGQSGVVAGTFTVPEEFPTGHYEAEILIKGAYEQCVRVSLQVCREQHCTCRVFQGDPPVRIRAHRWYDHFQCEEPCEPIGRHDPAHGGC